MEEKRMRMKDIAAALGVSVVTVSNALSGKPGVSEEKRAAILELAQRGGYEEERGRGKDIRRQTTGILISNRYISVGTSFYWEMYQNVAFALSEEGALSSLEILDDRRDDEPLPHCVQKESTDSLIIIGRLRKGYLDRIMREAPDNTVLMDFYESDYGRSAVLSNNPAGMYRSTQYLVDHGHREIGFVGTPETSGNIMERFYGFWKCMWDNNLPVRAQWLIRDRSADTSENAGIRLPEQLPSAFVTSSDYAAGILSDTLGLRGLHVPEDISIASYDDYLYDHPLGKKLTTFHVDMREMAHEAVRLLKQDGKAKSSPEIVYVDSFLAERESVREWHG